MESCRWNNANIDTNFYAGNQSFVNRQFNFTSTSQFNAYYFNLVQQPVNLLTGYQRQHQKAINYVPTDGSDPDTTDQYTRLIGNVSTQSQLNFTYSKSCELSAVAGLNLLQPYLDFTGDDPAQGTMKLKLWEYNSFMTDPYWRQPDMSDCNIIWCQEFISHLEAEMRFPDKQLQIRPMIGQPQRYGNFYFLPENYNMQNNDLMIVSYVWYKHRRTKKRLYSKTRNQFFDFAGGDNNLEQILYAISDFEPVTVTVPCWKLAVVLNDQLMFNGYNPLGIDEKCPFVPVYWNYDPHISNPDLRSRSLIYAMRSPQFLFNHKIITNNDIASATINAGWMRKSGAVANEDNLKRAGQGYDIIINEGYELTDVQKIIPSAVPDSDLALAQQMSDLIFQTSGIQLENWAGQDDAQISTLTALIKQAANLMVFQKYFDQWDVSFKLLGELYLLIALNNWNAEKVQLLIGEEPTPHFFSRIFAKYNCLVEEGLITPTQKNYQAQQWFEINQRFGREVIPASMIIADMNIQGKGKVLKYLEQQEQSMQAAQQEEMIMRHAFEEAKLREMLSKATNNIASAKERYGRFESNVGLLEERISEISKNHALSNKAKMEALEKLIEVIGRFGEIETSLKMNELQGLSQIDRGIEQSSMNEVRNYANEDEMISKMMSEQQPQQQQPQMQQEQSQMPEMAGMV